MNWKNLLIGCAILLCLVVPMVALAQDEAPAAEPTLGARLDEFLLIATPGIALLVAAIEQGLRFAIPKQKFGQKAIAWVVRGIFGLVFVGAVFLGADGPLLAGTNYLNELSEPLLKLLGLLTVIIGPAALQLYAGRGQGEEAFAFQAGSEQWRDAA